MARTRAARVRRNREAAMERDRERLLDRLAPTGRHCTLCHDALGLIDCVCGGRPDRPSGYGTGRSNP